MPFQSPRPRGRTRPEWQTPLTTHGSFNPRVLAGGRDARLPHLRSPGNAVSIPVSSRDDTTGKTKI